MSAVQTTLSLTEALERYWGYDSFRPLQHEAMQCALDGRDSVVVLPTGGGKSLCYQAPAVCRAGLAVVVSPLISLMKDQVDALRACGIPAACINSALSPGERQQVADDVRAGRLRLLYVAPERLVQERTLDFLHTANVSLIAVDEAHCISDWGHDFRPEYRALKILKESFPNVGVHAYTATATERVRQDIIRELRLSDPHVLVGSFDRPNLFYRVEQRSDPLRQVREVLDRHAGESGIIYCISRRNVDDMAAGLKDLGYRVLPYHAGLSDDDRRRHQEAFIEEKADVIVATVAFGMGIDKSNVRYVIHAGLPKSLEGYQQESGRAGRDGLEAECVLLYNGGDVRVWRRMLDDGESNGKPGALPSLKAMADYATGVVCRHRMLIGYFGQDLQADCGRACDVCLGDLDLVDDPLIVGQKILSSVVRQGQRFGGDYTSLVLKGSQDQRVVQNGHDKLSTYGLLSDVDRRTIRDWIEQLASQGFLDKVGEYSVLQVTPRGKELLRGEAAPRLLKPRERKRKERREAVPTDSWDGVDRGLFDVLRNLRREQADERGVPPYIVFADAALRDMARRRPSTLSGFRHIKGVGEKKSADFGARFLQCITAYCREHELATDLAPPAPPVQFAPAEDGPSVSMAARRAFELFRRGLSVEAVAAELQRAASTTYGYLFDYLRHEPITDPSPWVEADVIDRVEQAADVVGQERLKPIFEHLDGTVGYEAIRIVVQCLRNRQTDAGSAL